MVARRRILRTLAAGVLLRPSRSYSNNTAPYFGSDEVDLTKLLVPPPLDYSRLTEHELSEVKELQSSVSQERQARAISDAQEGFSAFVATTILETVDASSLPLTTAFIDRLVYTQHGVTEPAKKYFGRRRPPLRDDAIRVLLPLPQSGAYPSGHATAGTVIAIMLSELLPRYRTLFMSRAIDYATSRMIIGVHYRSDLTAGYTAGALLAVALKSNILFQQDFAAARNELLTKIRLD